MKPAPEKSEQEAIRRPTAVRDLPIRDKSRIREIFTNVLERIIIDKRQRAQKREHDAVHSEWLFDVGTGLAFGFLDAKDSETCGAAVCCISLERAN